jgi:hypothetical protein
MIMISRLRSSVMSRRAIWYKFTDILHESTAFVSKVEELWLLAYPEDGSRTLLDTIITFSQTTRRHILEDIWLLNRNVSRFLSRAIVLRVLWAKPMSRRAKLTFLVSESGSTAVDTICQLFECLELKMNLLFVIISVIFCGNTVCLNGNTAGAVMGLLTRPQLRHLETIPETVRCVSWKSGAEQHARPPVSSVGIRPGHVRVEVTNVSQRAGGD